MEQGSLLPAALEYMQKIRDHEHDFDLPFQEFASNDEIETALELQSALVISLYSIDSTEDTSCRDTSCRKELIMKLASIQNIIHGKLLPKYNKRFQHKWFVGGEGISFGLHCEEEDEGGLSIPHLRAVVRYGPHALDEFFSIALMKCISLDLAKIYGHRVAIACFDIDDGQILLIEGADFLPSWVDDEIGVEAMRKRVYYVNGEVLVLPPSITAQEVSINSSKRFLLTRKDALDAITSLDRDNDLKNTELQGLNKAIDQRIHPLLQVLTQNKLDIRQQRKILTEYYHTSSIVLPLELALLIQHRPDLVPIAIASFCKKSIKGDSSVQIGKQMQSQPNGRHIEIPFENLVFTRIMLPKTLYAMLLTAAGQLLPPIKIPKHYKSMEVNRIKRQCKSGGDGHSHFRHALECGIRLSSGFEWLTSNSTGGDDSKSFRELFVPSTEQRIAHYIEKVDKAAGGDGQWIQSAWEKGPNKSADDISTILKCPVWNPEITVSGICPIANPGKPIVGHVANALQYVRRYMFDKVQVSRDFPPPRASDVDSDKWIDMESIDDLEIRMKNIVLPQKDANENNDENVAALNDLMDGLENFVSISSDIGGVSTRSKEPKHVDKKIEIKEQVFFSILKGSLEPGFPDFNFQGIGTHERIKESLEQYFSNEDLDFDDNHENEIDVQMEEVMRTMDEQLLDLDSDRRITIGEGAEDESHSDNPDILKANILSNLLKSLDAQVDDKGPLSTIMTGNLVCVMGDVSEQFETTTQSYCEKEGK